MSAHLLRAHWSALFGVLLAIALAGPSPAQAALPSVADPGAQVSTGAAAAFAVDGSTAFVAGGRYFGGRLGGGAVFDSSSSGLALAPAVAGGIVDASVSDGSGGWYIGGNFDHVEGSVHYGLAHILANGSLDPSFPQLGHPPLTVFNSNEDAAALALSSDGKTLYVGGQFDKLGTQSRKNLGAVNVATDAVTSWNPAPDSAVNALVLGTGPSAGSVYAGGSFTTIGANHISSANVAKIGTANGNADSGFSATPTSSGEASSAEIFSLDLASSGNLLYIGGSFDHVGATARNNLARVNSADGTVNTWDPDVDGNVSVVRVVPGGGTVYAGGFFQHVLGTARSNLAAIGSSGSTASLDSWNPGPNSEVETLDFDGSNLVIGGFFGQVGGQSRPGLAEVSLASGHATGFAPSVGDEELLNVSAAGGRVFAGGLALVANGTVRSGFGALDPGGHVTGFAESITGVVEGPVEAFAVSPDGKTLYVGGAFDHVGGQPRAGLAAFDVASGALLPWNPGRNGGVEALAISPDGGTLYAGGSFTSIGTNSAARNDLAAISTANGSATAWNPSMPGGSRVEALALAPGGGSLYVGGSFSAAGHNGAARTGLAAISTALPGNATTWAPVLAGIAGPDAESLVVAGDGTVYVGGRFRTAGANNAARQDVAAISPAAPGNATGWNANITNSDPLNQPFVDALALSPDGASVVAGGRFDAAGGQPRLDVAELTTATGAATGWNPDLGSYPAIVTALSYAGPTLRVGGNFSRVGAEPVQSYAQFTSPPGDGHASIAGTVRYARTLTCSASFSNSPTALGYQWNRAGVPIAGATGSTHKVAAADTGHPLTCGALASNAGGSGSAVSAAVTPPPEITSFKISTRHVKRHLLAGKADVAAKHKKKKKKKPKGASFTFSITEKSTATIKIERRSRGVKVGKKCKARTRKLTRGKHRKACTFYKTVGSKKVKAKSGKNSFKLTKTVGRAHLTNGRYRGEIRATDSGRRKSNIRRVTFSVTR